MNADVYSKLRAHLDTFLLAAPAADSILEILRIRFTPEEAEIALSLGQVPQDVAAIAKSSGRTEESLRPILEQMADKALVLKETKGVDGVTKDVYSLLPTAVGLWETSFAKGERNPRTEQLARYWREYYETAWARHMHGSQTAFTRVIPVAQSIASRPEIYDYERASELIKQYDYACVLHCPCRKSAELAGKGCGKPTEVCVHFGHLARFLVEKGYARHVTQQEVLDILDLTEKAGLVHMVANSKEMGIAICSCCSCCCTQLRAVVEMPKPDAYAKSRFIAQVDADMCMGCGTCDERCQFDAIHSDSGTAQVTQEACAGCGLCVTACPADALSLKQRDNFCEPVNTLAELATVFAKTRTL
ncbi:MAG: ATP-binding protein [Terriglobales bacterium]